MKLWLNPFVHLLRFQFQFKTKIDHIADADISDDKDYVNIVFENNNYEIDAAIILQRLQVIALSLHWPL